jgi:hypothetical protein
VTASGIAAANLGNNQTDLVVGDLNGSGVYVLLGNGNGTFQAPVRYTVGGAVTSIAIADFNGDGKPDIAVAGSNSFSEGTAGILLGNGNGSFQSVTPLNGITNPISLSVGDFNNDGKPDLAIGDEGTLSLTTGTVSGSSVLVYLNNGNGTFPSPVTYESGYMPYSVVAADVHGGDTPDLIVGEVNLSSYDYYVAVLLGNGNGTFQSPSYIATAEEPTSIAVADINGDGKLDLAIAHLAPGQFAGMMSGNGDGSFQAESPLVGIAWAATIAAADMNGDGKPDLIAGLAQNYQSSVAIFLSLGSGPQSITVTPSDPSIVIGTTEQFAATGNYFAVGGTYGAATSHTLTSEVTWASATTGVATVSIGGLASGAGAGSSSISATLNGMTGSTLLTVTPLSACDVMQKGVYLVADAQRMINEALGADSAVSDLNGDGAVNVVDIQLVMNAVLGMQCMS